MKEIRLSKRRWSVTSLQQLGKILETPEEDPPSQEWFPRKLSNSTKSFPKRPTGKKPLVLHPEGKFRKFWDFACLLLVLVESLYVPYIVSFEVSLEGIAEVLDLGVQGFFVLDILLNFNTSFYTKGNIIVSRKLITLNYLKGWFWVDLVSVLPFDYLVQDNLLKVLRVLRFLKLLRLVRLAKLNKLLRELEQHFVSSILTDMFTVGKIVCEALLITHWISCGWYYVSYQDNTHFTWVYQELCYSLTTQKFEFYLKSLYFGLATSSSVGYGDYNPSSTNEVVFSLLTLLISVFVFSYSITGLSSYIVKKGEEEYELREKMIYLNVYMRELKLPERLRFKVRRYLQYVWEKQKTNKLREEEILSMLSEPLKNQIYGLSRGKTLSSCKVFKQIYNKRFIGRISRRISQKIMGPDDTVFEEQEQGSQFYFLCSGVVDIFHKPTGNSFKDLREGSYFGEISFFTGHSRCASARCLSYVELLVLRREDLDSELERSPEALSLTQLVSKSCEGYNYSALGIKCYICKKLGHVATRCSSAILNLDHQQIKSRWIQDRNFKKRYLNQNLHEKTRKEKQVHRAARHSSKNVLGLKRNPPEQFKDFDLISVCEKHLSAVKQTKKESPKKTTKRIIDILSSEESCGEPV